MGGRVCARARRAVRGLTHDPPAGWCHNRSVVTSLEVTVNPWYRQFYLLRGDDPWASDQVTREGYERRVDAIGGFVYLGTSMYGNPVVMTLELHDDEPPVSEDADHVAEVPLSGSGPLAVLSWGQDEPEATFELPAGPLRLRTVHAGLAAADAHNDNDLGGEDLSPETIVAQLWPAPAEPPRTIRAWG